MALDSAFGRDTSCTTSMKTGRFVTGPRLVGEACYRRLTTPRGSLRGGEAEANYGLDLQELIGITDARGAAASLPAKIQAELEKDPRIESVAVEISIETVAGLSTFTIEIEAITGEGPFELQILASTVSVELLGLTA